MITANLLNLKIRPVAALWLFMFLVFFTSPLNPNPRDYGFNSVEFSFFALIFIFIFVALLGLLKNGTNKLVYDPILNYCFLLFFLLSFSVVDTASKFRAIIFTLQYIPYFCLMYFAVCIVNTKEKLEEVIQKLFLLTLIFNLIMIFVGIYFNNRTLLDDFMKAYFQIELMKVLVFIELPFSILAYRAMNQKLSQLEFITFVTSILSSMVSGSRGCFLIMLGILFLALIKEKITAKKFLITSFSLILLAVSFFSTDYISERLGLLVVTSESEYNEKVTAYSRVYTMKMAWNMMLNHPINGVGAGNVSNYTQETFKGLRTEIPAPVIQFWERRVFYETTTAPAKYGAEMGVGGFLFFFVFYYYLWRRTRKAIKIAGKGMGSVCKEMEIFVVASFMHNILDLAITNYYTWFFYGLVIAACRIAQSQASQINLKGFYVYEKGNYNRTGWRHLGDLRPSGPGR